MMRFLTTTFRITADPDRAAARPDRHEGADRAARPGPGRRAHLHADPPRPRAGQGRDRHRERRAAGRRQVRARLACRSPRPGSCGSRCCTGRTRRRPRRHTSVAPRTPFDDARRRPAHEDVELLALRPRLGPLRAADLLGQRDRGRRARRRSASSATRSGPGCSTRARSAGLAEHLLVARRDPAGPRWRSWCSGAVFSVLGYFVTNWGFSSPATRRGRTFHVRRGLLTSTETSLERERVRGLSSTSRSGCGSRGAARLYAIVTGVSKNESGRTQLVPPAPRTVIDETGRQVLEQAEPLHAAARAARPGRPTPPLDPRPARAPPCCPCVAARRWSRPRRARGGWCCRRWSRSRSARCSRSTATAGWATASPTSYLVVRSGSLRGRRDIVQRTGIIGWNLQQSWFQRRAGLVTLVATTAAGTRRTPPSTSPRPSRSPSPTRPSRAWSARSSPDQDVQLGHISFLSTGSGACFITTLIGAHGSGGTQAESFSFSIASTIERTPFSVETIPLIFFGSTWSFISEAM